LFSAADERVGARQMRQAEPMSRRDHEGDEPPADPSIVEVEEVARVLGTDLE
jgi:hypothetical protein